MIAASLRTLLAVFGLCALALPSLAQSPAAAAANTAAYDLFSAGNYQEAADAYEKLLKDYPTDAIVPSATLQLAFSYYLLADFAKAEAALARARTGPPLGAELQEIADELLPQILSAKAAALPDGDARRKTGFEQAIKAFSDFLSKHPKAASTETVVYGKALAEYQIAQYDAAVKDLEQNLQRFAQSPTISSSKNLLAIILATQGSLELAKDSPADRARAFANYKRAADILREIIRSKQDIALINDANFQLGEILLNQAASSPDAEKSALYKEALDAFRAIAPPEQIITLQKEKIAGFRDRKRAALQQKNTALLKQLDRENERELKKLAEIQGKPDQTAIALQKMGEIYFQQGKYNEARVLFHHAAQFLAAADDKKRNSYFVTMSYAQQNVPGKAQTGYDAFLASYKSDPLADNLPLALGNMYLAVNNPTEALRYFDESLRLYPNGRFAGVSAVSKATAESRLGQMDKALRTFQDFLAKNPPPEVGVIAQSGLAGIYKDTQKWDDALAAYRTVKEKYPSMPQAVEADYWIAICTQQKGDNAAAMPLLEAFIKNHPDNPLAPNALYAKAGAQIAGDQKQEGIASLASLAEKYPASQPAPYTYFLRAQIAGQDGNAAEVISLMKQFIEKYPADDKVFFAYDSIAQTETNSGKPGEAVASYQEFAQKYPESPKAADAMVKIADLKRAQAEGLGRYGALNEQERSAWKTNLEESISAAEEMIKKYPDSPELALILGVLLQDQRLLLSAGLKSDAEVEQYFQTQADSAPSPGAKSKILFTLAAYVSEKDKAGALALMTEAYKPEIIYSPKDLDTYGVALLEQNKAAEAAAVFEKLTKDYPLPADLPPAQASPLVQEAQAIALFGQGRVAQLQGKTADAGKIFEQLKALYPWSPKVLEANYGIAESLRQQGKADEALDLLTGIIRAPTATAELRANGMLLGGFLMTDKMKAATDPKQKQEFLAAAIDYFIKIAQFYGGVPTAAARGLWEGGQLLEQQAGESSDAKFKAQQIERAKAAYQQLLKDFPNSEYAPKAQGQISALGGK